MKKLITILFSIICAAAGALITYFSLASAGFIKNNDKIQLKFAINDEKKEYDGQPLVASEYQMFGTLQEGHHEVITYLGEQTQIGSSKSDIRGGLYVEHLQRRFVYLLDFEILVDDYYAVWRVGEYVARKALRLLHEEGQAHVDVRLALEHGDGFFAAGLVAAGSAVQLVRRFYLARAFEYRADLVFGGHDFGHAYVAAVLVQELGGVSGNAEILLARVLEYRFVVADGGVAVLFHDGAAYAAARARVHLDKAVMHVARRDVGQSRFAVLHAVHGEIGVAAAFGYIHSPDHAAHDGEEARPRLFLVVLAVLHGHARAFEHRSQLAEGEHRVHRSVVRLVLFGQAGTDEHRFCSGNALLYV